MKTFTIIFTFVLFSFNTLIAQTIPNSAMPEVGDITNSLIADTTGISEGPSGNNITWDFSSLKPMNGEMPTMSTYVDPSATPHAAAFPTANLASVTTTSAGSIYNFYIKQGNQLNFIGGESFTVFSHFEADPMLTLQTGISPSDLVFDTFAGTTDNFGTTNYSSGTTDIEVDGSGTLKLPSGTFNNAVRAGVYTERIDSSALASGTSVVRLETASYHWYVPGVPEPVVIIIYTEGQSEFTIPGSNPIITQIPPAKTVVYNPNPDGGPTAVSELEASLAGLSISPNPCADVCTIEFEAASAQDLQFQLTDLYGRVMNYELWKVQDGRNTRRINLSAQPAGIYLITLSNGNEIFSRKLIKR